MSAKQRLVRWLPALVGLGLAGVGLGAVGLAQSGLTVTVAPPQEPDTGPDPLALLRDDVATLQQDLSQLRSGVGDGLQQLGQQLDGRNQERAGALQSRLERLEARLDRVERQQRTILERLPEGGLAAARPAESVPAPAGAARQGEEPAAEPSPAEEPVAAAPTPAEAPAPAQAEPKPRGLFSFKMKGGLDLDQRLRFQLIPSLSRVGFDAKSTLHDFSGVTSDVEGQLVARLGDTSSGVSGEVSATVATLRTGVDGRDDELRNVMAAAEHPRIQFVIESLETAHLDRQARKLSGSAKGKLTIHGQTREISVPVELSVDASRRLEVSGKAPLKMTDFGIDPPSVAGAIHVQDGVQIWLALRFRSLGPAED